MAISPAREESYLRGLLYLGKAPRKPEKIFDASGQNAVRTEVDAYIKMDQYNKRVQKYFLEYVFQGPTSMLGNTDDWIEGFYNWQRATAVQQLGHDEFVVRPPKGERE